MSEEIKDELFWLTPEPRKRYDSAKRAMLWDNDGKITGAMVKLVQLDKDKMPHVLTSFYLDTSELEFLLEKIKKGEHDE